MRNNNGFLSIKKTKNRNLDFMQTNLTAYNNNLLRRVGTKIDTNAIPQGVPVVLNENKFDANINSEINYDNLSAPSDKPIRSSIYDEDQELKIKKHYKSNINENLQIEEEIAKIPKFSLMRKKRKIAKPIIKKEEGEELSIDKTPLILYNLPITYWITGLSFFIFGFICIFNMIFPKKLMNGFYGKYKIEYLFLIIIFIFGFSFFVAAEFEKMYVDKINGVLIISKFNLLKCQFKNLTIKLASINNIFPTQIKFDDNTMNASCLNKIGIRFDDINVVYVFKSLSKYFTIQKVMKLRASILKEYSTYNQVKNELNSTTTELTIQEKI